MSDTEQQGVVRGPSWLRYTKGPPFGWLKVLGRGLALGAFLSLLLVLVVMARGFGDFAEAAYSILLAGAIVGAFFGFTQIPTVHFVWWYSHSHQREKVIPPLPDYIYSWARVSLTVASALLVGFLTLHASYVLAGERLPL